jgi:AraC-like DNA-binding protein
VLTKAAIAAGPGYAISDVRCRAGRAGWSEGEESWSYGVVFVRSGCFYRRTTASGETLVDAAVVYFERPGDEQQIAHPAGGDSCTALYLSEEMLSSIWGGEPGLPQEPVATDAETDLGQRMLLAAVLRGGADEAAEAVVDLAAEVLQRAQPARVASGRPATATARRRAVGDAREALFENPRVGVIELARRVALSPHHLSRVFKAETGETISRYRNRLRVRFALERLAGGEPCLARLAADLGFTDQAHLSRVVRAEVGASPSLLRQWLASGEGMRRV